MKLADFADHLEDRLRDHLQEVTVQAAQAVLATTPGDRKKTRQAVRATVRGNRGEVGLRFRTKYPTKGTPTLRRLQSQWKALRPQVRKELIRRINDTLKGN